MIKLRRIYNFGSLLNFHHAKCLPYTHEPSEQTKDSLLVQIHKYDSDQISKEIHKLQVDKIKKGGQEYIYKSNQVDLIVGYKEKPYDTGAKSNREARARGFSNLIINNNDIESKLFSKYLSGIIMANYRFKVLGNSAQQKEQQDALEGIHTQIQQIHVQQEIYDNTQVKEEISMAFYKCYARELSNQRQQGDTNFFLNEVNQLYKDNSNVEIFCLKGDQLLENGLNLLHAVGRGSVQEPMLINLTYKGNPNDEMMHCMIGKGIIFDTGGYHLKPYGSMEKMFLDKQGACNVLAAFRGAVEMGLKINLTVTIGLAENSIGNKSYKPSEIIKSHKGLTVEINNTDAEGRLVLADCISWTQQQKNPQKIIEISTLTGACWAALGDNTAGIFSNNDELAKEINDIGETVSENFWRLPVTAEHFDLMKGDHSDLCNVGKGKVMGAQKAGAFLMSFLNKEQVIPFVHLDIAGPMESKSDKGINSIGATGFGTSTLLKYLINNQK